MNARPEERPGGDGADDLRHVSAACAGDHEAFQHLYRKYYRLIAVMLYQKLPQAADTESLTQDVFLHAWRGLPRLRDPRRFLPWLLRICRHLVTDWLRAARRRPDMSGILDHAPPIAPAESRVAGAEEHERVMGAFNQLPDRYRLVLALRFLEAHTPQDIAARLGEPDGTIRNRIFRGLRMLKQRLEQEDQDRR